jgi:flagellar basal body-associated protein FliL
MKTKIGIIVVLLLFVGIMVGASVWMYNKYVVPNSKFHTEIKARGQK